MAIIYSYPPNNNVLSTDTLVCTSTTLVGGKTKNQTKSLSIAKLSTYVITNSSNNLNQVLTNGNTSLLDAKIGELYLYDGPNVNYAKISIQDDLFSVIRATSGTGMFFVDNGYSFTINNGTANATIINPLTVSRTYTLPDKSGTFALTSDLTNLVTTNTVQTITASKTFNGGLIFDAEQAAIAMHNRYDMGQSIGITLYDTATDPEGLRVNNNNDNGTAIAITNSLSGYGFYGGNNSTGILMTLAASASSTGDLLRCFKNSVITTKVDTNGNITAPSFVKTGGTAAQFLKADGSTSTAPTLQQVVDAGNYSENAILIDVASAGNSGPAVSGIAGVDTGVYGASDYGWGIFGQSEYTYGVYGYSTSGFGGYFSSNSSYSLVAAQSAAKPGGGSWSVFSDSRIKENIIPYTKGLADILLINTVTYEYNGLAGTTKGAKYTGIIAQEIKEIFPDTVKTYKAKLNEDDEEKTELYDFNSSDLTFALINAVKELKAEIEILKAK